MTGDQRPEAPTETEIEAVAKYLEENIGLAISGDNLGGDWDHDEARATAKRILEVAALARG